MKRVINKWKHRCSENGNFVKEYQEWNAMKGRCRKDSNYQKEKPSYIGCYMGELFLSYDSYYEWRNQQIGAGCKDEKGRWFALDKDLIAPGNKCYGPDFVVFIPLEINGFLTRSTRSRSRYGKGVHPNGSGFSACVGNGERNKVLRLGTFKTADEAYAAHCEAKNVMAKELAKKWRGKVDEMVYKALMDYDEAKMERLNSVLQQD